MPPSFFYFDLGNVLLHFDMDRAARQIAEVAGISAERVSEVVFNGLAAPYERGELDSKQFYEIFCEQTGTRPDYAALEHAASAIFELNVRIVPLVAAMHRSGHRLGILSNTNSMHWKYVSDGRYGIVPDLFERIVLSFEIGAMKPDREIFTAAAEMAGVPPEQIFYTDDRPEHVEGAREVGFDAVTYTTTPALAAELRQRNVPFIY
jgi:putative hydrolase of the HAD superfamily